MMIRKFAGALLLSLAVTTAASAAVVALKRDAGLDWSGTKNTAAVFDSAVETLVTVADAPLNPAGNSGWMNYGTSTQSRAGSSANYVLYKFDLSTLAGLSGGTINLAQLRLYHIGGNGGGSGGQALGQLLSHDWIEGTKDNTYPGAAGGASFTHPAGVNTTANRNAANGTATPWASWGAGSDSNFSPANDGGNNAASAWGGGGSNYTVWDVTGIVASWADGSLPNYGFEQAGNNFTWQMSESGSQFQPVLFIDYTPVPEPATMALLVLGSLTMLRRRQRS